MLLYLVACAPAWVEPPYTCEHDVVDWWEGNPAWLLSQAQADDDGVWHFDAASGYGGMDRTEGYWDPSAGELGYTEHWIDASSREQTDLSLSGSMAAHGDFDLAGEVYAYDELGAVTAWTVAWTQRGCVTEQDAWYGDDETPVERTWTAVDADTIEGTYAYAPFGAEIWWEETSTLTRDLVETVRAGWNDGSYVEDWVYDPAGTSDVTWADHSYADRGWELTGEQRFALDGSFVATTWDHLDGVLQRECTTEATYAGVGTATCYEPPADLTCDYAWDTTTCTYTCDDGETGSC